MTDEPVTLHPCRLPRWVRVSLFGLVGAVFLLAVGVGLMATFVYQQQQYIEGRGEYRDREQARAEAENVERTRAAMCDLLDTFPEGVPSLQRARDKYQCGPGIPIGLLTPEERARLGPRSTPSPESAAILPPPVGSPATPGVTRPKPNTPHDFP